MAVLISFGNMGGICGSNIYIGSQAPKYPVGFGVCLAMSVMAVIMAIVLRHAYAGENKRRDQLIAEHGAEVIRSRYTDQELLDLGDRNPFFRYTL
jgi:hypothetical protein